MPLHCRRAHPCRRRLPPAPAPAPEPPSPSSLPPPSSPPPLLPAPAIESPESHVTRFYGVESASAAEAATFRRNLCHFPASLSPLFCSPRDLLSRRSFTPLPLSPSSPVARSLRFCSVLFWTACSLLRRRRRSCAVYLSLSCPSSPFSPSLSLSLPTFHQRLHSSSHEGMFMARKLPVTHAFSATQLLLGSGKKE